MGSRLYEYARGIDNRSVEPNRIRKSLSVEQTFIQDIDLDQSCLPVLEELYEMLIVRIKKHTPNREIKNQYIKIKLSNFKQVTIERSSREIDFVLFQLLLQEIFKRNYGKIRLMGVGVHFNG